MRRLVPGDELLARRQIDPLYVDVDRPAPPGRPWVAISMVTSLDGASSAGGHTEPLGGDDDLTVFGAVRTGADVILAGAETVRTERYGLPKTSLARQEARIQRGQTRFPRLAVLSASGVLDPGLPLFTERSEDHEPPLVLTGSDAARRTRAGLEPGAEVVDLGDEPTAGTVLGELGRRDARLVTCEGGPTLAGHLAAEDLIDELCLTISPQVVGGPASRITGHRDHEHLAGFTLVHTLAADDGALFLRLIRHR